MPIADNQIALLETVRAALDGLQTSAASVEIVVQSVTVVFPGGAQPRNVTFTWQATEDRFDISS